MCGTGQKVSLTITGPGPSFFLHSKPGRLGAGGEGAGRLEAQGLEEG